MPLLQPPLALREADLGAASDRARIDGFVRTHPQATPFHLTAWSIAVERGCRQRPRYLVAERADGGIAGVLPLTQIRSLVFGRALVSAGFGVGGGALASTPAAAEQLVAHAWSLAGALKCPGIELRGGPDPGEGWQRDATSYCGFVRDLARDDEAELAAIPRKQRAEVRKALTNDLGVTIGRGVSDLKAHYAVYSDSVRNLGTPVFPKRLFAETLRAFDDADILTVWSAGVPVASVLSLYANGTVYPYWGGGTAAARGLRANDRMYFALMSHARARGCTRFDFGRSKTGTGPAAFKKNWGFEPHELVYFRRTADGARAREVNPLSPKYRAKIEAWKRLPLPVANLVGPWLARGLG